MSEVMNVGVMNVGQSTLLCEKLFNTPVRQNCTSRHYIIFLCICMGNIYIDDQHRNPNMNNKVHIVGQLTSTAPAGKLFRFTDSKANTVFIQLNAVLIQLQCTQTKKLRVKEMVQTFLLMDRQPRTSLLHL